MGLSLDISRLDHEVQIPFQQIQQQHPWGTEDLRRLPQARVFNSANIATTTAVTAALTFNSERWDFGTPTEQHSTASNTSRLTCVIPGLYGISGSVQFADNAAGYRLIFIRLNGTSAIAADNRPSIVTGFGLDLAISTEYRLAAGDYVELCVNQNSGGNLNVLAAAPSSPEFSFHWVSP